MGTSYLLISLSVVFLIHWVPTIADPQIRRGAAVICLLTAAFLVVTVFNLYTGKTGYHLNVYLW